MQSDLEDCHNTDVIKLYCSLGNKKPTFDILNFWNHNLLTYVAYGCNTRFCAFRFNIQTFQVSQYLEEVIT